MALAVLGCAVGLLAGVRSGPLWLDEALSVEIARLPLTELPAALRQDGAPPLYYLLLKSWMAVFGQSTEAVRLLSVVLVPVALLLVHRLAAQLHGASGARAAVVVLAALPWTMRYGSETRMYVLVVVLVLAGALALRAVHLSRSPRAVAALALCAAALALTHYWGLLLLAGVALVHLPPLLRRRPEAVRVAIALAGAGLLFLPWAPTFLFQSAHTGAPWADPVGAGTLLLTPHYWGAGGGVPRTLLALLVVPLAALAAWRQALARRAVAVVVITLVLAWTSAAVGNGAYTGRYTAVVVPVVALLAGSGAVALGGRWRTLLCLTAVTAVGLVSGIPAAASPRSSAAGVVSALRATAAPGDLVAYCPDQLGPAVARELGPGLRQVVYPSLEPPQRLDWVDYRARQQAADPTALAARVDELGAGQAVFVLAATEYRTFEGHCEALLRGLARHRGTPGHLFGVRGTTGQQLYRFPPPR